MFPPWEITSRHVAFSNIGVTMSHEFISTVWNPDCIYPVASFIYLLGCFIYMYFKPYILRKKKKNYFHPSPNHPFSQLPQFCKQDHLLLSCSGQKVGFAMDPWLFLRAHLLQSSSKYGFLYIQNTAQISPLLLFTTTTTPHITSSLPSLALCLNSCLQGLFSHFGGS